MPKKLTQNEFIEKAKKVHGDKYDYSKAEYVNSGTKVCIKCPKHGEFWQTPLTHLYGGGCGCKECRKEFLHDKFKSGEEEFIEKAKKVHGDKYDYSKVRYVNSHNLVTIICNKHGEFVQAPYSHLNGRGCPECGNEIKGEKISKLKSLTTENFIEKAREIHGDKYDYSEVKYKNNHTKICVICEKHGEFWQMPEVHLRGSGCPFCKESTLENEVYSFLSEKNIIFEREKKFDWLKFKSNLFLDFYLPVQNIVIECQGIQHFTPVTFGGSENKNEYFKLIKERDKVKKHLCEEHGIKVFYFFKKHQYFLDGQLYNENTIINNLDDIRL